MVFWGLLARLAVSWVGLYYLCSDKARDASTLCAPGGLSACSDIQCGLFYYV